MPKKKKNMPFSAYEQGKKLNENKQRKQGRLDDIMKQNQGYNPKKKSSNK